jgi:lipopolysaccharide biosynthesis glycosyltransferase
MKSNIEIPVVFATDENYVLYMSTAIQSVMMNAGLEKRYRIYVLHANTIAEASIAKLKEQVAAFSQFTIEFVDVLDFIKNKNLFVSKYSIETYFRVLIPYIFTEYEKVLYLDCDIICKVDIAEIYETELDGYLFAAARDQDCGRPPCFRSDGILDGISLLNNPESYFNAGVLLFNIKEFSNFISVEQLFEQATSRQWAYPDQDLLNVLCENRVKYIPLSWNLFNMGLHKYAPKDIQKEFETAQKNPKIIHFVNKPLTNAYWCINWLTVFFEYAQHTPFIDRILVIMYKNGFVEPIVQGERLKKRVLENIQSKSVGMHFVVKCFYLLLKNRLTEIINKK